MRRCIISLLIAIVSFIGCNESLEDTYSDYAGDGKIRYVAKCTDFHANPGWQRLILEWINGTDATIDKIKLVWTCEGKMDSIFLSNTTENYELTDLKDGTYRFDICAVDKHGNESLKETTYGRPYTREHEVMLAFTRGVVKSYFVNDKLVFFSDRWNNNIDTIKLQYKNVEGETQFYVFDKETSYDSFITIDNVSNKLTDTVYVLRTGRLEGCVDLITFDPMPLNRTKIFSSGFVNAIERRYGYSTDSKEHEEEFNRFIENVKELEFDYDIDTFEDVLYCPNLQKLVFGKNRYLDSEYQYAVENDYPKLLTDVNRSIQVLDKANEILGMTIDWYGGWNIPYFNEYGQELPYMTYMDFSPLPKMDIIKPEELRTYANGEKISCSPTDRYAELKNLLDNDYTTVWETTSQGTPREYNMMMELLQPTEIKGVKVTQVLYNPMSDRRAPYFMPSNIKIQVSEDGGNWQNVTFFESNELGRGSGETTLLKFPEGPRKVRYIKFTLRDGTDLGGNCMIILGDIVLYK